MRSTGNNALASPTGASATSRRVLEKTTAVGRVGILALEYVRQGGRTVFGRTRCQSPWHLLPPIYLDESGSAYTLLVNPSGGLVGGDHLSIELSVGASAHALISTPSANRVYRSLSRDSVQEVSIRVAEQGILEWMPEHTIPFGGSRFRQSIDVKLATGASLLLWDAIAAGRIAHGERWTFATLTNQVRITMASGATVQEHYALTQHDTKGDIGLVGAWDYIGSLFVIGDAIDTSTWASLDGTLADILEKHTDQVLGGVSQPAVPGLVVKLVARSAPVLTATLHELWAAVRQALWKYPPAILRKY